MGLVNNKWIKTQERHWSTPEKYVCAECVVDEFLQGVVDKHLTETECSYCGLKDGNLIAAPLAEVFPFIAEAFFHYFQEPSIADFPRESGEWVFGERIKDTADALLSLDFPFGDKLIEDICNSFRDSEWVSAPNGLWCGEHEHEWLQNAWERFESRTKHTSRYFFIKNTNEDVSPSSEYILKAIGDYIEQFSLWRELPKDKELYRARKISSGTKLTNFDELSPPPPKLATAGRMNPAGISYGYCAFDPVTAILEVSDTPPSTFALAKFALKQPLLAVDLTGLPKIPSIFDIERERERDPLIFLHSFVQTISKPVSKDGREHVEYVPSQIVSEYIAQVLSLSSDKPVGALLYRSAVDKDGINIVIFPQTYYGHSISWKDVIELLDVTDLALLNWQQYSTLTARADADF